MIQRSGGFGRSAGSFSLCGRNSAGLQEVVDLAKRPSPVTKRCFYWRHGADSGATSWLSVDSSVVLMRAFCTDNITG